MNSKDQTYKEKFMAFAIRMVKLKNYLNNEKHEYNNSDQLQRSGTSIGANYSEACDAESKADFVHKMTIALKEANETIYWLKVLYGSKLISQKQYDYLMKDLDEIYRVLTASIKTAKEKLKKGE